MVSSNETDSFVEVESSSNCCILMFVSHSFLWKSLLTRLSLAPVSRRRMCVWRFCASAPNFKEISYVDLGSSVSAVGVAWKISLQKSCWRLSKRFRRAFQSFSHFDFSENRNCSYLTVFKAHALAVWWVVVRKGSACFPFFIRLSDLTGPFGNIGLSGVEAVYFFIFVLNVRANWSGATRCVTEIGSFFRCTSRFKTSCL